MKFQSPISSFAGSGAPSNALETSAVTSVLASITPQPLSTQGMGPSSGKLQTVPAAGGTATDPGFKLVAVKSDETSANKDAPPNLDSILSQARAGSVNADEKILFVVDGGIRLADPEKRPPVEPAN